MIRNANEQVKQLCGRPCRIRVEPGTRRRAKLEMHPPNTLRVLVPKHMKSHEIQRVIQNGEPWIEEQLRSFDAMGIRPYRFASGDLLWYRGRQYSLEVEPQNGSPEVFCQPEAKKIIVRHAPSDPDTVRRLLEHWYSRQARELLPQRAAVYQGRLHVKPAGFTITGARKRWGSCSPKGRLSFSWLLMMMPDEIIDYVVVHELCHLLEMNHSRKFWSCVGRIVPDWRRHYHWLQTQGRRYHWPLPQ